MRLMPLLLAGSLLLSECGAFAQAKSAASGAEAKPKQVPERIDLTQAKVKQNTESFVLPVPSEIVERMHKSNYGGKISAAVNPHVHNYAGLPSWQAALTLGAGISDVLLALESLPKEKILAGLDDVLAGMKALKLPDNELKRVADMRSDFAADKITKAKLVSGFDGLRSDLLNLGKPLLGSQNYGLLIVGGWARGANVTAQITRAYPQALADLEVLKVRNVIDTLLTLVGDAPEVQPVVAALKSLLPITTSGRTTPPTAKEAGVIETATGQILSLIKE